MTNRRNKDKLCNSLVRRSVTTKAMLHGKQFESKAIMKFEQQKSVKCLPAGFFIKPDYPFLGASPDGVINDEYLIEVKCPFSGRNENVLPGKPFPFLHRNSHGEVSLKQTSNYYSQIQGQLFITKKILLFYCLHFC